LIWKGTWFRIAKCRCFFPLHILQCLTIQGLTSSGGGSSLGGDGGNSSGVSRALVKDKLITSKIFMEVFQVIFVTNVRTWWDFSGSRRSICNTRNFFKSDLSGQFLTLSCESLRLAVAEVLLPAYKSFVKRFGCVFSYLK